MSEALYWRMEAERHDGARMAREDRPSEISATLTAGPVQEDPRTAEGRRLALIATEGDRP